MIKKFFTVAIILLPTLAFCNQKKLFEAAKWGLITKLEQLINLDDNIINAKDKKTENNILHIAANYKQVGEPVLKPKKQDY